MDAFSETDRDLLDESAFSVTELFKSASQKSVCLPEPNELSDDFPGRVILFCKIIQISDQDMFHEMC